MFSFRFAPCVLAAMLVLTPALSGQEGGPETDYFPLKKGNTWIYSGPGDLPVEVKVTASQSLGKSTYFTLETRISGKISKEDVTVNREKEGEVEYLCVYRGRVGDQPVNPPLRFFRVPAQMTSEDAKPDQWTVNSKVGKDEEIKGTFVVGKADVEIGGKMYKTVTVTSDKMSVSGQPVKFKYYFAQGEGMVKQEVTIDKLKVELKLLKFEAGK